MAVIAVFFGEWFQISVLSRDSFKNEGEKHESGCDVKGVNLKKLERLKKN